MLALRWSSAKDLFVVALLGAATLFAPHRRHHAPPPVVHREVLIDVELVNLDPPAVTACADAELLYEHREFELAASALRCAAPSDPGQESHAQLYDQLARAWDRAMAPDATPVTRFDALRYARRLDLSLGGRYADELDAHLREAAPLAAAAYAKERNHEGLELALTTCDALGVPAAATKRARR
ncbi:MAG TPA: hypothetical protein VFQ65_26695 [Kofleriaceae bacterium]|nr:hypothetical protein [Kofleriaceae bacterium]